MEDRMTGGAPASWPLMRIWSPMIDRPETSNIIAADQIHTRFAGWGGGIGLALLVPSGQFIVCATAPVAPGTFVAKTTTLLRSISTSRDEAPAAEKSTLIALSAPSDVTSDAPMTWGAFPFTLASKLTRNSAPDGTSLKVSSCFQNAVNVSAP